LSSLYQLINWRCLLSLSINQMFVFSLLIEHSSFCQLNLFLVFVDRRNRSFEIDHSTESLSQLIALPL
jgi:hypothetical protein